MMKKVFFLFAVCAVSIAASAQTTRVIKGAVIDKKGNPLPGATVNATGGSDMTTVDADGSFSMEVPIWLKRATAQYAGMKDKTIKIKGDDLVFRMKPDRKMQWFIIANYSRLTSGSFKNSSSYSFPGYSSGSYSDPGFSYIDNRTYDYSGNMGGLMFGRLGKWGWYGKFNVGSIVTDVTYVSTRYNMANYDSSNGVSTNTDSYDYDDGLIAVSVTAGVTKRIIDPLHVYLGLGAGYVKDYGTIVSPEIGLIGKLKNHYLLHFGYQPMIIVDSERLGYRDGAPGLFHVLNIGIGYAF